MFISRSDRQGRLVYLNQAWLDFARENWRADFEPELVLGAGWRQQISDPATLHLYDLLVQRALRLNHPVAVAYRCDSPDLRRYMEMRVSPLPDGGLEWASRILREEPRAVANLLETRARRSERLLRVCSWCKKVQMPDWAGGKGGEVGHWVEVEEVMSRLADTQAGAYPDLTHGACPDCYQAILEEMEAG